VLNRAGTSNVSIPASERGQFYSGNCYLILYVVSDKITNVQRSWMLFWQGLHLSPAVPPAPAKSSRLLTPPPGKDAHARTWTSFCLSLAPLISEKVTSGGHAEPVRVPIESLSFEEKKLSG
jgi:hypothetical protein